MTLRLLAFAASLRAGSFNRRLLALAVGLLRDGGAEVDQAEFAEFDMPLFNHDVQQRDGFPAGARELARRVEAAHGLVIASPEYNYSIPGTLKNAVDWVSRMQPMPLRGRSALLLSASTSVVGGSRGQLQLRIPLESLGVFVHPEGYTLPGAAQAFAEDGSLVERARQERLERLVAAYLGTARALAVPGAG
ncbi:MAG TPA: NAD(P)H-dependent oxidoreductase [Gemmatimonadales bacterium]|nr:NAD(P)H-dependent oxidoreductase [Gemmatimonadales bacterium]